MEIIEFKPEFQQSVNEFYDVVMSECGRVFEPEGRHKAITDIIHNFGKCWCLFDEDVIIGTVAVKPLSDNNCELKMLYLYKRYQHRGLGKALITTAIDYAKSCGYSEMRLDTLSTSIDAIGLYQRCGFVPTERYNENYVADVFMRLEF